MIKISKFEDFTKKVKKIEENKFLLYRGHEDINYNLLPSLYRNKEWLNNEVEMYQDMLINCPDEFANLRNPVEILAKMQHHGLPTRLLDVSESYVVALYFACLGNKKKAGEVIIFDINRESIKLSYDDVISQKAKKLFDFRKDDIIDEDIQSVDVIFPERSFKRLIKQSGAFLFCSGEMLRQNNNESQEKIHNINLNDMRLKNDEKMIVFLITRKEKILAELDKMGFNKSYFFPEIDDVAEYIKSKYK